MAKGTREIKRRIKSIGNTKKITKAMELVAAAKMRKAVESVLGSRSYSDLAWQLVRHLSGKVDPSLHPLLAKRQAVKKVGLLLITSNRGLCGGFNSQIIQRSVNYVKKAGGEDVEVELITLGRQGASFMARRKYAMVADFEKPEAALDISEIRPMARLLIGDFLAGKYDKVAVAYTDFVSTLVQKPRVLEILPLDGQLEEVDLGEVGEKEAPRETGEYEYVFEPSPKQVLTDLLPRLIETRIYQAILESSASEHSARMVAMQNATEAAKDMIDDLTLAFNKARQAAITSELADISGGRAAVE